MFGEEFVDFIPIYFKCDISSSDLCILVRICARVILGKTASFYLVFH